jgi:hypothetical protein
MKLYRIRAPWTAASLALHMQAVLQGAFILAKAKGNARWSKRASITCVAMLNCCSSSDQEGQAGRTDHSDTSTSSIHVAG